MFHIWSTLPSFDSLIFMCCPSLNLTVHGDGHKKNGEMQSVVQAAATDQMSRKLWGQAKWWEDKHFWFDIPYYLHFNATKLVEKSVSLKLLIWSNGGKTKYIYSSNVLRYKIQVIVPYLSITVQLYTSTPLHFRGNIVLIFIFTLSDSFSY